MNRRLSRTAHRITSWVTRTSRRTGLSAILWWGAFENGGGTIGDVHAVENISRRLDANDFDHVVVSNLPIITARKVVRDWKEIPGRLGTIIFVCGPIVHHEPLLEVMETHRMARREAVGVSVLASQIAANACFDDILKRDGLLGTTFDPALAGYNPDLPQASDRSNIVAACLRGPQHEYGPQKPALSERAEELLLTAANQPAGTIERISTIVDPDRNTEQQIIQAFARADIIATTRMHGALYALAHGRPPIAIDQVTEGAKVSAMLDAIGWPLVYRADSTDLYQISEGVTRWGLNEAATAA